MSQPGRNDMGITNEWLKNEIVEIESDISKWPDTANQQAKAEFAKQLGAYRQLLAYRESGVLEALKSALPELKCDAYEDAGCPKCRVSAAIKALEAIHG